MRNRTNNLAWPRLFNTHDNNNTMAEKTTKDSYSIHIQQMENCSAVTASASILSVALESDPKKKLVKEINLVFFSIDQVA